MFYFVIYSLLEATNEWAYNIDSGNVNAVMFLDLKKAFDTVDHEILLNKLNAYGIKGTAGNWLRSYLNERNQKCFVNGHFSCAPTQAHTAQHTTGNIHTPKQNMATYCTNSMTTTINRPHILLPRGPLTPTTTRPNFHYRPNTPTLTPTTTTTTRPNFHYRPNTPTLPLIPFNPLLQQTRYPLTPAATTTRPNFSPRTNIITQPLLSNHIQQQIHNFIQPRHILDYLQGKQRTNNNRK